MTSSGLTTKGKQLSQTNRRDRDGVTEKMARQDDIHQMEIDVKPSQLLVRTGICLLLLVHPLPY